MVTVGVRRIFLPGRYSKVIRPQSATRPHLSLPMAALRSALRAKKALFLWVLGMAAVFVLWQYVHHLPDLTPESSPVVPGNTYLVPRDFCPAASKPKFASSSTRHEDDEDDVDHLAQSGRVRNPPRVLLIPNTSYSSAFSAVKEILVANRIKFKHSVAGKNLPDLIKLPKGTGKFGVVFFEDFRFFLQMDAKNRDLLVKYCKKFNVGIASLVPPDDLTFVGHQTLKDEVNQVVLPFRLNTRSHLSDLTVNATSSMLRLTRGGQTEFGPVGGSEDWVTFEPGHKTYTGAAWASKEGGGGEAVVVMQDHGGLDSIRKVFFGGALKHFVNKLLFIDALHWLSHGKIAVPLTRYVLVDIDDVFVGKNRFQPSDVVALLESQRRLARLVPGFKYNLGFSGGYFRKGATEAEAEADEALVTLKEEFWWFPHTWMHYQAHKADNVSDLVAQMQKNRGFAEEKALPVDNSYAVAPHHSGVYPVHQPLYDAWGSVWDIRVTSTEEYPHLRPARLRRGFVHSGVAVLPRQTCGLFTKNLFYSEYPGGPHILEDSIHGGELFLTLVYNPISIFMTHMPNYCEDRLAPYAFESVVNMVQCWTNLRLRTRSPTKLAEIYFGTHPEERTPIWGDPCEDHRHLEIWSESKSCGRLPRMLVVGPQKTGTTALYKFLKMHPSVSSNYPSETSFEELQFFSGQNYLKGVDWYMEHFPDDGDGGGGNHSSAASFLFEKSATYFDHDLAPLRAHRLVGDADIVAILISPSARAYSWYQHMVAHDDPTALEHSFHQVVTAGPDAPRTLRSLQSRCLEPGKYASHLERWLTHFKAKTVHLVDGESLKYDPASVLNKLQRAADIRPFFDYSKRLVFDKRKGYYCEVVPGRRSPKCLGKGKGRQYPPMQPETKSFLRNYYRLHNEALVKLMGRLGYAVPGWLEEELRDGGDEAGDKQSSAARPDDVE